MCRRFFDPAHYRIICFDQRGCGSSEPAGCLVENTTRHLVHDMEQLRSHLGVSKWLMLGGSWGVALTLAYAVAHTERCGYCTHNTACARQQVFGRIVLAALLWHAHCTTPTFHAYHA